jgi:hypothetical protein
MYYLTDNEERALALASLPQPAGGSPLIISSGIELRFAYAVAKYSRSGRPMTGNPRMAD